MTSHGAQHAVALRPKRKSAGPPPAASSGAAARAEDAAADELTKMFNRRSKSLHARPTGGLKSAVETEKARGGPEADEITEMSIRLAGRTAI